MGFSPPRMSAMSAMSGLSGNYNNFSINQLGSGDEKRLTQGATGESGATRNHQIQENENEDEEDEHKEYDEVQVEAYDDDVPQNNDFEGFGDGLNYEKGSDMISPGAARNMLS